MPTFIRPQAVGFAGEVNAIAIDAFSDSEILTAVKNGSGNLVHKISALWRLELDIARSAGQLDSVRRSGHQQFGRLDERVARWMNPQ